MNLTRQRFRDVLFLAMAIRVGLAILLHLIALPLRALRQNHQAIENVAEALASEIHARSSEETIVSDLTYDLRSGVPDFVDKLVASTFGTMALESVLDGKSGLMAALVDGKYAMAAIPDPALGPRHVDVATMYNTERYRPNYANKTGLPIFLTRG